MLNSPAMNLSNISRDEFLAALNAYEANEKRGPVYFQALRQLNAGWGCPTRMAKAIGVLLRSWHCYFYHFAMYDVPRLVKCIEENMPTMAAMRHRTIDTFSTQDEPSVDVLFRRFTLALRGINRKGEFSSETATAKALHLLAPQFLPLWDDGIALAYGKGAMFSQQYIEFCFLMKDLAQTVRAFLPEDDDRTILKRLDEFNYTVYTKRWVRLNTVT